jgi:hypothetical protein
VSQADTPPSEPAVVPAEVSKKSEAAAPIAEITAAVEDKPMVQDSTRSLPLPKQGELLSETVANKPVAGNEGHSSSKPAEGEASGQKSDSHS